MQPVTGIGGISFGEGIREALSTWHEETLGITRTTADYDAHPWEQQAGPTVFAPFPRDTEYFGDQQQTWMINFRVVDLDGMIAQLRARGIEVTPDEETYPNGRFARLSDPEGTLSNFGSLLNQAAPTRVRK